MSIQEIFSNIKQSPHSGDLAVGVLLVSVGVGSFFLGRASTGESFVVPTSQKAEVVDAQSPESEVPASRGVQDTLRSTEVTNSQESGAYVGSRNGTKYHLPWCSGAKRIKDENKIWFETKEEAERAGYTPAANCEGI